MSNKGKPLSTHETKMEQYTKARLFETKQEDLDGIVMGNILSQINYKSARKIAENLFEINQSITISN